MALDAKKFEGARVMALSLGRMALIVPTTDLLASESLAPDEREVFEAVDALRKIAEKHRDLVERKFTLD